MKKSTLFSRLSFRFKLASAFPPKKGKKPTEVWLKAVAGAEALTGFWQSRTLLSEEAAVSLLGFFTGYAAGRSEATPDREKLGLYMAARMRSPDRAGFSRLFLEGLSQGRRTPHKKDRIIKALSAIAPGTEEALIRDTAEALDGEQGSGNRK